MYFALPPLCASLQDSDNARPSLDTFETEPGRQPGVLILPLHSTLIPPESFGTSATERLISVSLPPLNPFASMCDFRQDKDNDVRLARPWLNHDTGFGLDLRDDLLAEGFKPDTTLLGAYMVVDAFATYRWAGSKVQSWVCPAACLCWPTGTAWSARCRTRCSC